MNEARGVFFEPRGAGEGGTRFLFLAALGGLFEGVSPFLGPGGGGFSGRWGGGGAPRKGRLRFFGSCFLRFRLVGLGRGMVFLGRAFYGGRASTRRRWPPVTRQGLGGLLGLVFRGCSRRLQYKRLRAWAPTLYVLTTRSLFLV